MANGKVSLPYRRFLGYEKGPDGLPVIVESEAVIIRLIYRLFPGEKALVCDDYRGITFNEHTETSMAGSTNYFVFSGDLTWCMLHEYGHESEPDA